MSIITEEDWSFARIRSICVERAERLEQARPSEELVLALRAALVSSIEKRLFRIGIDSRDNAFVERRAIIQFPVTPEIYDWFFNARTGYRAQFWISPEKGMQFNNQIVTALSDEISIRLDNTLTARKIEFHKNNDTREERDIGDIEVPRSEILRSLSPEQSKIWICENLYDMAGQAPLNIGFAVLSEAEKSPAKLCVPKWSNQTGEGLRAPIPDCEYSWLDLKGGFVCKNGRAGQEKSPEERARSINSSGWT